MDWKQILPFIVPVIILQLGLQIWSTLILIKEDTKVKFNKKWIWAVVIWLFQIPGALVFLLLGRSDD